MAINFKHIMTANRNYFNKFEFSVGELKLFMEKECQ
jgi:hypothetical protein